MKMMIIMLNKISGKSHAGYDLYVTVLIKLKKTVAEGYSKWYWTFEVFFVFVTFQIYKK